jgi:N-terminal domain of Peptidase_S41 in eukaryotic IRBP
MVSVHGSYAAAAMATGGSQGYEGDGVEGSQAVGERGVEVAAKLAPALAVWQEAHQAGMDTMRRELSLRLPSARLLEFTFDDPGAETPRITMPDDGSLAAEHLSGPEIVTTAMSLLRANYVFPEVAEQAATAVEARLAAGEYDDVDEITLTELLTSHLQEITGDKHLRLRLGGGPRPGPGPGP